MEHEHKTESELGGELVQQHRHVFLSHVVGVEAGKLRAGCAQFLAGRFEVQLVEEDGRGARGGGGE